MTVQLKDQFYNRKVYRRIADDLRDVYPALDADAFFRKAVRGLDALELNDRMRRTAELFREFLPEDFDETLAILLRFAPRLTGYPGICVPEFIGRYGVERPERFDRSMRALRDVTEYSSSEFAVRSFLQKDFERALAFMTRWSRDKNYHVRRLSSEGLRPRLPWAANLRNLIADPRPALGVLENLKADPELYVRKSVANHLNDIAKDHPDLMLDTIERWDGGDARTAWIQKHAARSLIKAGHPRCLKFFGFGGRPKLADVKLDVSRKKLRIGEELQFILSVTSAAKGVQNLVLDYRVDYRKKNGEVSGKVFKLKAVTPGPGETLRIQKRHSFVERTTRKHYAGEHRIEILANGMPLIARSFILES